LTRPQREYNEEDGRIREQGEGDGIKGSRFVKDSIFCRNETASCYGAMLFGVSVRNERATRVDACILVFACSSLSSLN